MTAGTVGMPQSEIEATLRERLLAGEQAVAEAVYSAGTFGQAPSLANNTPAATALAGTLSLIEGIMALESWLAARSGLPGVLYIPTIASAMLSAEGAFWRDGGIWRTAAGNAVAIGNFAGLTPAGGAPAAGSTNLYITESLTIWRTPDSQIFVSPFEANVTFTTNQVAALARREYVITHAGLVAGVESVLSPFCCGRLPA
jgi:hypothetical protein